MKEIDTFITKLSRQTVSMKTTNLYSGKSIASGIRRHNLRLYLNKMLLVSPEILLLGEAPGYKGCGRTGVPFTSERILMENDFFSDQEFQCIQKAAKPESEMSATIVWEELDHYFRKPLIWNIFPFHPHKGELKRANRTPNQEELDIGAKYVEDLIALFNIKRIIALGRKPESKIKDLGYDCFYVRHPANGGKRKFVEGVHSALADSESDQNLD